MFNNFNPYYQQQRFQPYQQPTYQPNIQQEQFQQQNQMYRQPVQALQGKTVDNIEVVKATEIPLDGTVSYFPLADNTAIVTKQLQADGTSRIVIYKPVNEQEAVKTPKYITSEELDEAMKKVDNSGVKEEIEALKRRFENLNNEFSNINKYSKK